MGNQDWRSRGCQRLRNSNSRCPWAYIFCLRGPARAKGSSFVACLDSFFFPQKTESGLSHTQNRTRWYESTTATTGQRQKRKLTKKLGSRLGPKPEPLPFWGSTTFTRLHATKFLWPQAVSIAVLFCLKTNIMHKINQGKRKIYFLTKSWRKLTL